MLEMPYFLLVSLFTILMLPGIMMAVMPGLPGLLYMLFVAFVFGIFDHFVHITDVNLAFLALVVMIGMLIDIFSGLAGAKIGGAHWSSLVAGALGLLVGTFVIPIPILGSFVGFFFAILCAEWYRTHDMVRAHRAATGGLLGALAGTVGNVVAASVFIALFIIFAFF